jgi:hypothetical protein
LAKTSLSVLRIALQDGEAADLKFVGEHVFRRNLYLVFSLQDSFSQNPGQLNKKRKPPLYELHATPYYPDIRMSGHLLE